MAAKIIPNHSKARSGFFNFKTVKGKPNSEFRLPSDPSTGCLRVARKTWRIASLVLVLPALPVTPIIVGLVALNTRRAAQLSSRSTMVLINRRIVLLYRRNHKEDNIHLSKTNASAEVLRN